MATKVRATRLVDGKNDDKGEDDDAKGHDGGARDDVDVDEDDDCDDEHRSGCEDWLGW